MAPIWKPHGEESLSLCNCHQAVSVPTAGSHFRGPARRRDVISAGDACTWVNPAIVTGQLLLQVQLRASRWQGRQCLGKRREGETNLFWVASVVGMVGAALHLSAPAGPDNVQFSDMTGSYWPSVWKTFHFPCSLEKLSRFFQPCSDSIPSRKPFLISLLP